MIGVSGLFVIHMDCGYGVSSMSNAILVMF